MVDWISTSEVIVYFPPWIYEVNVMPSVQVLRSLLCFDVVWFWRSADFCPPFGSLVRPALARDPRGFGGLWPRWSRGTVLGVHWNAETNSLTLFSGKNAYCQMLLHWYIDCCYDWKGQSLSFKFLVKFLKIELFPFLYKIPATAFTWRIFLPIKLGFFFKTRQKLFRSKGELQTNVNTLIFQ